MNFTNEMMKCTIYYEAWEMACCGTPFSVGDVIKWGVSKNNTVLTPVDIGKINYCYDAHSFKRDQLLLLTGKVEKIKILYHKYVSKSDEEQVLIAVDGKLFDVEKVQGFEENFEDMQVAGYVVELSECIFEKI